MTCHLEYLFLDLKALVYGSQFSEISYTRGSNLLAEIRMGLQQRPQAMIQLWEHDLAQCEKVLLQRRTGQWTRPAPRRTVKPNADEAKVSRQFQATCWTCKMSFELRTIPGLPGFLSCPRCRQILSEINVTPWQDWIVNEVAAKRKNKDRSYWRNDPEKCSEDGIGAELAACLSLCPGHFGQWMSRTENLNTPNPGQDLLGVWVGCKKDFEIKSTRHYDEDRLGFMYIRQPSNMRDLSPDRDIHDSIHVLFTGKSGTYCGRCWAGRRLFRAKGIMNPPLLPSDGWPTFGNHHSKFVTYGSIVQELGLKPADVTLVNSCPTA